MDLSWDRPLSPGSLDNMDFMDGVDMMDLSPGSCPWRPPCPSCTARAQAAVAFQPHVHPGLYACDSGVAAKWKSSTDSTCIRMSRSTWGKWICSSISASPSSTAVSNEARVCPVS